VDIFQFNNTYALTPDIEDIVASPDLQDECVRYVATGIVPSHVKSHPLAGCVKQPSFATLFELYCSIRHGKTLKQWILENRLALAGLDVRRFISFGMIKGFLYRVHRYPVLIENTNDSKRVSDKRKQLVKYDCINFLLTF
jgi:nitrogen permease regulator 2-like protein